MSSKLSTNDLLTSGWKMRLPCRYFQISQFFGQNLRDYSQFGLRGHNGLDLPFDGGEKIISPCDGIILKTQTDEENKGYGNTVWIQAPTLEYKGTRFVFEITLGHLLNFKIKEEQEIKEGDFIGIGDTTGYSTGNHIHITLKPKIIDDSGVAQGDENNGYYGAIDPFPFIKEKFPFEVYKIWAKLDNANPNYRTANEGKIPVDVRYWRYYDPVSPQKRPWHAFLREKWILGQLGLKGFKAGQNFTYKEINALVYGGWGFEDIFGVNSGIALTKTWQWHRKYN